MFKKLLTIQLFISGIAVLVVLALDTQHNSMSAVVGSVLMTMNLAVLVETWRRIFLKKSIALAVTAIVFKYAILGTIIYLIVTSGRVQLSGFLIGLTTVLPTIVLYSLMGGKNFELKQTAE